MFNSIKESKINKISHISGVDKDIYVFVLRRTEGIINQQLAFSVRDKVLMELWWVILDISDQIGIDRKFLRID